MSRSFKLILVLAAVLFFAKYFEAKSLTFSRKETDSQIRIGEKVPDFSLQDVSGRKFSINDYFQSKAVILWFSNLCGGCQANIPVLEEVYMKHKKSAELLAVSQLGRDTKTVKKVIGKLKISFPFLIDPEGVVCRLYSGGYIPDTCPLNNIYFIDKNGILKAVTHYPGLSKEELEKNIKMLKGGTLK